MMTLEQQMDAIRTGQMTQFYPPIQVQQAQLQTGVELEVRLPGLCSAFWLPPSLILDNGAVYSNPPAAQFGIRMNLRSAPLLHWGLSGNLVANFTGPLDRIFILPITGVTKDLIFLAARGIGVAFSGGNTAAGTPSGSPAFGQSPGSHI